nr:isopeptide-forming domain-containing fimbrial protein [Enterococcus sp. 7F3_DIV0205]OTN86028.1 hypothetical protein A5821_001978 [Enterococcus sp. 7F3_DIV0205]
MKKNKNTQKITFSMIALMAIVGIFFLGKNVLAHETSDGENDSAQLTNKIMDSLSNDKLALSPGTRANLPDFNWRLLDTDNIDLSTFQKVDVNTPVKLTGGAFSIKQRDYYMYFGHPSKGEVFNHDTGKFEGKNIYAKIDMTTDRTLALTGPAMIGVKKGTSGKQQVFGYDYSYNQGGFGASNSSFDIGVLDDLTGKISASGRMVAPAVSSAAREYITEQYVKENEIVSYGYFLQDIRGSYPPKFAYLPVRVHGYVANFKKGRIRYDVSFYNQRGQQTSFAVNHSSHMDVGGNHTSSRLFSYGTGGLYFNEPDKTIADGIPARIYFYTNIGYPEGSNMPTEYLWGNLGTSDAKVGYFNYMIGTKFVEKAGSQDEPYLPWSNNYLPMHEEYILKHPVFIMRWPKITVPNDSVGTATLDMSIEEPELLKPTAEKSYENTTSLNGENMVGDILDFEVIASNDGDMNPWQQVTLEDKLPPELELDTRSLVMVDVNGIETSLPASIYDPGTHTFAIGKYDIEAKKSMAIKYKAKIVGGSQTTIINRFKAYNDKNDEDEAELSIPVKGEPAKPEAAKTYTNNTSTDGKDRMDDSLTFELSASNAGEAPWQEVGWKDEYPAELELDKESFVLVDDKGVEKKVTPIFHASLPSFTVSDTPLEVQAGKKITLRYKAKIISGEGTTITNKVTAYTVSDSTKKAEAQVAIPVFPKKPLIKDLTIHFVNKAGEKIAEPIIRSETIGSIVKLKEEAETVGSALYNAIKAVEANQFKLVERPANEASVEIIDGVNEVTYVFDGKLLLYSAPNRINFSTHKYDGKTARVNAPAYDQDLVVKDGRSVKDKWTLTAKLTAEMTHIDPAHKDSVLKNAIRYVYEGKEIILDKGAQPIMVHTNEAEKELYNISTTWNGTKAGDGFKLEVDPGDVKKLGSYQGEILWELAATPDP